MRKFLLYTLLAVATIILLNIVVNSFSPLKKPEEKIKESILKLTPIGMSIDNVIKVIEGKKEWTDLRKNYERGVVFDKRIGRPTDYANYVEKLSNHFDIIGEKSTHVLMGNYSGFLVDVYVVSWWSFDEDSKLIDVIIGKEYSGF